MSHPSTRTTATPAMVMTPATALLATGAAAIIAGGLVAAVTGPLGWEKGSWAAAYLVLVVGVAQYVMGATRAHRTGPGQLPKWGWMQVGAWNFGSALIIIATLVGWPPLVDLGSVFLVIALGIALHATRTTAASRAMGVGPPPILEWGYRGLLLLLLLSIPVGMLLSHLRH